MAIAEQQVQAALKEITDPNTGKDYVTGKEARNIKIDGANVSLDILLGYPAKTQVEPIRKQVVAKLKAIPGIGGVTANVTIKIVPHAVQRGVKLVPGIKNIIAVASGKGGVGKSTTAVNLALALSAEGATVGMLDADIYGPSQPMMLGITGRPESKDGKSIEPMEAHGLQASSIGFMIDIDTPMVWRGPMVTQALEQLLKDTRWRDLDYLVVDLPPGTGDIQLTMVQKYKPVGAIIISTPQDLSLIDATRAVTFFNQANVPIIGVVENMAGYACPHCGEISDPFGTGGAQAAAMTMALGFLGRIPLDIDIRTKSDAGTPPAADEDDIIFAGLASKVLNWLNPSKPASFT